MTIAAQGPKEWRRTLARQPDFIESWLVLGRASLDAGDVDAGYRNLRRAVAVQLPGLAALEELAGRQLARNDLREAASLLQVGLRYSPGRADWWNNVGVCAIRLGNAAQAFFRVAVVIQPENADYALNLAHREHAEGNSAVAYARAGRAHALGPSNAAALVLIGHAAGMVGAAAVASRAVKRALALVPSYDDGWGVLAAADAREKVFASAQVFLGRVLALKPFDATAQSNFAEASRMALSLRTASRAARRAIALDPSLPQAHGNLSLVRQDQDFYPDGMARLDRALVLKPDDRQLLMNRAVALKIMGRTPESIPLLSALVEQKPDDAMSRFMLGTGLMSMKRLAEAWPHFEWRLGPPDTTRIRPFTQPLWDGVVREGRLLVWGEQGLGDEVIFSSMLPDLVGRGVGAIIECDPRLVTIIARSFPTFEIVARTTPPHPATLAPDVYAQTPMGSLARWLRPDTDTFFKGRSDRFLHPDPDRVRFWKARLEALPPGPKIGLAWRSGRKEPVSVRYSTNLIDWRRFLANEELVLVCLQYGEVEEELEAVRRICGRAPIRFGDLDLFNDIEGGLALGAGLDLVVSQSTSATTLAASTGTPMLVATWPDDWAPCGLDRLPWFPGSRAYQRQHGEGWSPVIERIYQETLRRVSKTDGARSGRSEPSSRRMS